MFGGGAHDADEFAIHLNEILVVLLVNFWRTYFGDDGMQVVPLGDASRPFGVQELLTYEDRAVADVARHGGVWSRTRTGEEPSCTFGDGICERV